MLPGDSRSHAPTGLFSRPLCPGKESVESGHQSSREHPMSWQPDVDELQRRAAIAREMGGPEAVAFHKSRGKLTVRERLDLIADPGTFTETGVLAGKATYEG